MKFKSIHLTQRFYLALLTALLVPISVSAEITYGGVIFETDGLSAKAVAIAGDYPEHIVIPS